MKDFLKEFKEFINRGNVMDLAVAVIIGGAFTGVVTSLTDNLINPLIQLCTGGGIETSVLVVTIGSVTLNFSAFISSVINFLVVALVVFCLIKALNKANEISKLAAQKAGLMPTDAEDEPVKKAPVCPFCKTEVPEGAIRCPHCTSQFEKPAEPTFE